MKKRVLSALLVLCMACSMVSTVWAANEQATPETADKPASVLPDDSQSAPVTNAPAQDQDVAEGLTAPEDEESGQQSDVDTPDASQPEQAESTGTPVEGGIEYTAALEQDGQALNVIVTAPEGAFDEGVEPKLSISAIEDEAQTDGIAAKLDEYGLTYDGFAALDISFKNEAGEEIEPNVPVTVRIELPDSIVDSGIDLSTLAVQHLAEDESGNVISVDEVASVADDSIALSDAAKAAMEAQAAEEAAAANAANGIDPMNEAPAANNALGGAATTEAAAVAEFDVDGFSAFTITWSDRWNTYFQVTVHYMDENGKAITGKQSDDLKVDFGRGDSATYTFSDYAGDIDGYTYLGAHYQAVDGNVVTRMVASQQSGRHTTRTLTFYNGSGRQAKIVESITYSNDEITRDIYLVYQEDTPEGFYIDETIAQNGLLTATFGEGADVSNRTFNYVWYRRAPDGDWVRIERTVASGDYFNMEAENGTSQATSINAVLDGYVADRDNTTYLYDYKVEAYEVVNGEQQEQPSYEAELQMPYYYAIQNGDFEKPENSNNVGGEFRVQDTNSEIMWKTTETTGEIELVTKGDNAEKYYGLDIGNQINSGDYEGHDDQIAELNAKEEESSLYQDIATVPGTRLYWSLDHRARDNTSSSKNPYTNQSDIKQDTMYVLIMSAEDADELLTSYRGGTAQEKVRNYIEDNPGALNEYIWEISDDAEWGNHGGDYVVPENQFLTRFFFVAGDTVFSGLPDSVQDQYDSSAEPKSVGNFIDNVTFDKNVPPPSAQHGNLQITKHVEGVQYLPGDYQVEFTLSKDGEPVDTVTIQATEFENNAAEVTILNLEPGEYTITETDVSTVEGYTLTGMPEAQTITVTAGRTAETNFTNTYEDQSSTEPVVSDPTIRKYVYVDDKGDGTYDLSLDVTGTTGKEEIPINVLYVLDESYSMMWTMDGDYPDKDKTWTDAEGKKHGPNPSGDNKYPNDDEDQSAYKYSYDRFNSARRAITTLNEELASDENLDVQVAMVTFANNENGYTGESTNWTTLDQASDLTLPELEWETFASGTNYYDAFTRAQTLVAGARDTVNGKESETIVVFVTDGEPNWPRPGDESHENIEYAKQQAAEALRKLDCDRFYAVGVGRDIGDVYLHKLIASVKQGVTADAFQSGDTTALVNYFNQIAADIAGTDTHNVTIVDKLSEYAELTSTTAIPQIEIQKDDGSLVTVHAPTTESEPVANGIVTYQYSFTDKTDASSTSETTQTLTYMYYPANTYGENEDNAYPVITLAFPDEYALTKDWTYTITLPIRPTAAASTYLSEHNGTYPNKGERDEETGIITDVPESNENDWTSTDKEGFFSNTEATLTYDSNDTLDQEKTYLKPVIQVNTADLTITKAIVVDDDSDADLSAFDNQQFTFTVKGTDAANSSIEKTATITWDADGANTATVEDLPIGNYTVSETDPAGAPTGYTFVGKGNDDSVTVTANGGSASITNHYKHNDVTLTVNKYVTGDLSFNKDEFTFSLKLTNSNDSPYTGAAIQNSNLTPVKDEATGQEKVDEYTFTLTAETGHNTLQITLPYGVKATVTETDKQDYQSVDSREYATENSEPTGYTNGQDNQTATMVSNRTIDFRNTKDLVEIPTGLDRNDTPYALMITAAGIAGLALIGAIVNRRIRRRRED